MHRINSKWLRLAFALLLAILCTAACAQEREEGDEDETAQTEKKDSEAAKRARKGERKSGSASGVLDLKGASPGF